MTNNRADRQSLLKYTAITCTSFLLLALFVFPVDANAQGAGLYKDGKKVLDLEPVIDSVLQPGGPGKIPGEVTPTGLRGVDFRRQVLGLGDSGRNIELKEYFSVVVKCRDLVRKIAAEDGLRAASPDDLSQLATLSYELSEKSQALVEKYDRMARG
ncbi:MAG: hypothetical protein IMY82_00970, partial [Chloroflexi bacterium]|nr:hypothetical protein [Chloroflexota bacterium]